MVSFVQSKVHFKSRGTDCKILNIFANSHLMHVISILMDSKHHIDNFQSVLVAKTAIFSMKKKNTGKFSVFWKTDLCGIISISAYSPLLEESKNIYFILVFWPEETQEFKMCHELTRFPSAWKTVNFCVTSRLFFRSIFLLFLSLFVYLYLFMLVAMTITA